MDGVAGSVKPTTDGGGDIGDGAGTSDGSAGDETVFGYRTEAQLIQLYKIFSAREAKDRAHPVSMYRFMHKTGSRWMYTAQANKLTGLPFQSEVVRWGNKRKGERGREETGRKRRRSSDDTDSSVLEEEEDGTKAKSRMPKRRKPRTDGILADNARAPGCRSCLLPAVN